MTKNEISKNHLFFSPTSWGGLFLIKDNDPIRFKSLPPNKKKTVTITRPFPSQHVGSVLAEGSLEHNATALIQKVCIKILSDPPQRNGRNIYDIPFHYTRWLRMGYRIPLYWSIIIMGYMRLYWLRILWVIIILVHFRLCPYQHLKKCVCVTKLNLLLFHAKATIYKSHDQG